ncbi:MAG: hypothetical protein M3303_03800 [Gemmatimonadota bacterium]|nr:hypothetical protein [Gemmatimonadota bacterium]
MTAVQPPDRESAVGFRSLQRRLAALLPGGRPPTGQEAPLERLAVAGEAPRLIRAATLEGGPIRAHRVFGDPEVGFEAFLDGTQTSRVLDFVGGIAVVYGTAAAVIRVRRNRRLATWGQPAVSRAVYLPRRDVPAEYWSALGGLGVPLVDTSDGTAPEAQHPFALRDAAVHRVQKDREQVEQRLAERWCSVENGMLFIDGGISGSERVAVSSCTVGVVKSHRTLYAEGDELQRIFELRRGERSSVFRITSPKRIPVASWYLRLRDPAGHDPLWGLVRVEIAQLSAGDRAIGERASEVSRWVLAETAPLALPDARWDKMVYGVRDCEEFLRAIV